MLQLASMAFSLYLCVLFLWSLSSVVSAGAPGDGDTLCTDTLPASGEVEPAPLPSNAKILMDSYDYLTLLSGPGAVWQQVDLDNNNAEGRSTEWSQNTNSSCRQMVTVCGFREGPQDNWLITQYIRRRVGDVLLSQVSVQVVFGQLGCTDLACQRTFVINMYETSTEDRVQANNTTNYQQVSRVAPDDDTGLVTQNQTSEADFSTDAEGFYIAIRDETTCIVVQRLIVFYNVCPEGPAELVMRPETIAPRIERLSQPLEVTAQCVEGASPIGGGEVKLNCVQGGVWSAIPGSGCSCNPGFNASADRRSCIALCEAGEYYSMTFSECRLCPANSVGEDSGLPVCPCAVEYYRADGEEDIACTRPPSMPRSVEVVSMTSTSVTLSWEVPLDLGGRDDVSYVLCYEGDGMEECTSGVDTTTGTITGLSPGAEYNITVTAMNGVSSQVPPTQNATSASAPLLVATDSVDRTMTFAPLATDSADRTMTSVIVVALMVVAVHMSSVQEL